MKKVIVIVDKTTTVEQMTEVRDALLDPNRPCIVGCETLIKQVINVDFDEVDVVKENEVSIRLKSDDLVGSFKLNNEERAS